MAANHLQTGRAKRWKHTQYNSTSLDKFWRRVIRICRKSG